MRIFSKFSVKCEVSHNNKIIVKVDCKILSNAIILETVSSDKNKEALCRILRFFVDHEI